MSNIHGRDNSTAQNHYENMPIFYGYKEILQPFFQSSLVKQHSSEISQLGFVEDIKHDNLDKVKDFINCSLIALSNGVLRIEDTHLQSFLFEQQEGIILHEFHDPVASWMELYFSKVSNATTFCILPICSHKYQLPIDSLLHLSHLLWVFSNSSMHGIMILSEMVSWLQWKYDYT